MAANNLRVYNTISGLDIQAVFGNTVFGEIQMVSYKIDREKAPVYTMGSANLRTIARGKRLVTGACVFVLFDRDSLLQAMNANTDLHPALNKEDRANLDRVTTQAGGTVQQDYAGLVQNLNNDNFADSIRQVGQAYLGDQLLAFDITLVGTNEYGASTKMVIKGVELMTEASGVSIDDLVIEKQFSFIAREVQNWTQGTAVKGSALERAQTL